MKVVAYLLIFLLLSGHAGDPCFAFFEESQADRDADGDDSVEYPLAQREQDRLRASLRTKSALADFRLPRADFLSFVPRREVPTEAKWISPFRPPPLYVFMSLLR